MNKLTFWLAVILLGFLAMYFFEPTLVITAILFFYAVYLYREKHNDYKILMVAFLVGSIWFFLAKEMYHYNEKIGVKFLGMSLFPLVAWTAGLVAFYYLSNAVLESAPQFFDSRYKKIVFGFIFYSMLIIAVESFGYNVLGVKLLSNYSGFSFCNCFHAPLWMQVMYFLNGYIFIGLSELVLDKTP